MGTSRTRAVFGPIRINSISQHTVRHVVAGLQFGFGANALEYTHNSSLEALQHVMFFAWLDAVSQCHAIYPLLSW